MTASEKLQQLVENGKLTDEQQDNLRDWGIITVSELRENLIDLISELKYEAVSIDYEEAVMALSDLLDHEDDDYVLYDESGLDELDFDVLRDALDVD